MATVKDTAGRVKDTAGGEESRTQKGRSMCKYPRGRNKPPKHRSDGLSGHVTGVGEGRTQEQL